MSYWASPEIKMSLLGKRLLLSSPAVSSEGALAVIRGIDCRAAESDIRWDCPDLIAAPTDI